MTTVQSPRQLYVSKLHPLDVEVPLEALLEVTHVYAGAVGGEGAALLACHTNITAGLQEDRHTLNISPRKLAELHLQRWQSRDVKENLLLPALTACFIFHRTVDT